MNYRPVASATAATLMLLMSGCLERKETIRVKPDATVEIELAFSGDAADVDAGDAMPDDGAGWDVSRQLKEEDDKQKVELTARREFEPGAELPDCFATDAEVREVALQFPTQVTREKRADGTYYHFQRTYQPRTRAQFEYHRQRLEKQVEALSGKNAEELSADEKRTLLGAMREVELAQRCELVQSAADATELDWPAETTPHLQQDVRRHFEDADLEQFIRLLEEPESDERDARIAKFSEGLIREVRDVLSHSLAELRRPQREIDAFLAAYDQESTRRDVTMDLDDERFVVRVELPGELAAHNGRLEDGAVVWEFEAGALMDRTLVLKATSVDRTGSARP